eukprot:jgi/Chlat1/6501/Chrsp45S05984
MPETRAGSAAPLAGPIGQGGAAGAPGAGAGNNLSADNLPAMENFNSVQGLLDRNRLLINEIKKNHDQRNVEGLARNVPLIRELNSNIAQVVEMYKDLSTTLLNSVTEP